MSLAVKAGRLHHKSFAEQDFRKVIIAQGVNGRVKINGVWAR